MNSLEIDLKSRRKLKNSIKNDLQFYATIYPYMTILTGMKENIKKI